jgi:chromosome segregation ATPase
MSSFDPLGLRPDDPLEKHRREAEAFERKCAQAREEMKREEQRNLRAWTAKSTWNELEQRLGALERAHGRTRENLVEVAQAAEHAIGSLADERFELPREQREEIRELKTHVAKLTAQVAELREQRAGFQFAREREEGDLPKVLPRRDLN